jgi:hypothetical protein
LEVEIRADAESGEADLVVRWTDPDGKPIGTGVERRVRAGEAWASIRLAATAPRGAASARIEIRPVSPQPIQARALRFFELR